MLHLNHFITIYMIKLIICIIFFDYIYIYINLYIFILQKFLESPEMNSLR